MSTAQSNSLGKSTSSQVAPPHVGVEGDDSNGSTFSSLGLEPAPKKRKRSELQSPTTDTVASDVSSATIVGRKDDSARPAKRIRGKRGFLQQVSEMPLELLFEIFSELDPMDLLNLARTTKALRAILMQQSSRDVWKAALSNVPDLPPHPHDLTEPQWVDLLYGKNCCLCGKTNSLRTQTYAWEARIRGCFSCVTLCCLNWRFLFQEYPMVRDVTPSFEVESESRRPLAQGTHYHSASYDSLLRAYQLLQSDEDRAKWLKEKQAAKAALEDVIAFKLYLSAWKVADENLKHASDCDFWLYLRRSAREDECRDLRDSRKLALRARVENLGYVSSIVELTFENPEFWKAACVTSILKKDITDRVWARAKAAFLELIDGYKSKHLKEQRSRNLKARFTMLVDAHQAYIDSLPIREPAFTAGDLLRRPAVRKIVLAEPLEAEVDPKFLSQVVRKMAMYNRKWLEGAKQFLVEMLKPKACLLGLEKDSVDESSLDLAAVLFACRRCKKKGMRATDLFHHSCARSLQHKALIPRETVRHMKNFISQTEKTPWNFTSCVAFDSDSAKSTVALVKKLGLNAATLTVQVLDELDPIFEVPSTTGVGGLGRAMYSWRGLLAEDPKMARSSSVVDEKTSISVRELLDEDMRRKRADERKYYGSSPNAVYCTHCRKRLLNIVDFMKHLTDKHGIQVVSDKDFWIHPDQPYLRTSITYYKHAASTTTLI